MNATPDGTTPEDTAPEQADLTAEELDNVQGGLSKTHKYVPSSCT